MIYIKIQGGLGNQMFQYASAKSLAIRNNTGLGIDLGVIKKERESDVFSDRNFELEKIFNLAHVDFVEEKEYSHLIHLNNSLWYRVKSKFVKPKSFYERDLRFDKTLFSTSKNVFIQGYFQSPNYFQDHWVDLKKEFQFKQEYNSTSQKFITEIGQTSTLAIHVRRGDYANKPEVTKLHGLCSVQYYKLAFDKIYKSNPEITRVVIFSDDPTWCKEHMNFDLKTTIVDWNTGNDSWQDMALMSKCDHFIIANSSFSWWGAYLSENKNKMVVAPKVWFADSDKNKQTSDLFPSSWILV